MYMKEKNMCVMKEKMFCGRDVVKHIHMSLESDKN